MPYPMDFISYNPFPRLVLLASLLLASTDAQA